MEKFKIVFIGALLLFCAGSNVDSRHMWVWNTYDLLNDVDDNMINEFFNFCDAPYDKPENAIKTVYLDTGNSILDPNLPGFIQESRTHHDLTFHALSGDEAWATEHDEALQFVESVLEYNDQCTNENQKFSGIHLNVECDTSLIKIANGYTTLLAQIGDMLEGEDLLLGADTRFFWEDSDNKYASSILDVDGVDYITVIVYRDYAGDSVNYGIIDVSKAEIEAANQRENKSCIIAVETMDIEPESTTFYEEGFGDAAGELEGELADVINEYADDPGFGGIAIHHYGSYFYGGLHFSNLSVDPPPIAHQESEISFTIRNDSNLDIWGNRPLVASINCWDIKDNPPEDSYWLDHSDNPAQIRDDGKIEFTLTGNLNPGEEEIVVLPYTFRVPSYTDLLEIDVRTQREGSGVDDYRTFIKIQTDSNVVVGPNIEMYLNCFGEVLTGITHGIVNETFNVGNDQYCYEKAAWGNYYENGIQNQGEAAFQLLDQAYANRELFRDAGEVYGDIAFQTAYDIEEVFRTRGYCGGNYQFTNAFIYLNRFLGAAFDEFQRTNCAGTIDDTDGKPEAEHFIAGFVESVFRQPWDGKGFAYLAGCPVDIQVIDSNGDTTSVHSGGNIYEGIEGSVGIFASDSVKSILVPATSSFEMKMMGYGEGYSDLTIFQDRYSGEVAKVFFHDVPITATTIAMMNLDSTTTEYDLYMDYDGDGDYEGTERPDSVIIIDPVGLDSELPGNLLPKVFALAQNYPNPFNPSTTIAFDIPEISGGKQHVRVTIYDLRGRRVKMLVNSDLEPGGHEIHWDGRDDRGESVSSGIYLYTLKAGSEAYTRKMTILK